VPGVHVSGVHVCLRVVQRVCVYLCVRVRARVCVSECVYEVAIKRL